MTASLPKRRQQYSDSERYTVFVLWLYGSTLTAIATRTGLRRKQVAGLVARSDYTNRAAMSRQDRQRFLNELLLVRADEKTGKLIDGGRLPDAVFTARALDQE